MEHCRCWRAGDPGGGVHDQDASGGAARRPTAALCQAQAASAALAAGAGAPRERRHTHQDRRFLTAALQHQPQEGTTGSMPSTIIIIFYPR